MGFFDRIRKGKLYHGKKEAPAMVVEFLFRGHKYIAESFDLSFQQDVNEKNKPDSETYGGLITVTISNVPDHVLVRWAVNTYEKRDGEFRFFHNHKKITESAALNIVFKEAYCINYHKTADTSGAGVLTTLTIAPRSIKIGNEEFENN